MRKYCSAALVGAVAAMFALSSSDTRAQAKDTLVVAQQLDAYNLDPARHTINATGIILSHIYDTLVIADGSGGFKPSLAESWSNPDPRTWRFKLRQGVKFHNGEPFNAEAVKFSFERVFDKTFVAPRRSRISMIEAVEIVDDYTVDLKTSQPFPTMLYAISETSAVSTIVPPKLIREKGADILMTEPVGTGPYRFVEWVKDDRVVLKANPDYWGGAPKIENLVFRPIKEIRTRVAELTSGRVDIAVNMQPEDIASIESSGAKAEVVNSDTTYFLAFSMLKDSPLMDKRVRQAISYAIDVDAIREALFGDLGSRIALNLPTQSPFYDKSWTPYPYDPEKAKALLAEAGYPDGFTIPFLSRRGQHVKDSEIVEASAAYLAEVGIKAELQFVEQGVFAQISEKKGREGIVFPGWSGLDPDLVWYPLLSTGEYQSYYSNPELDALLKAGHSTIDEAARKEIYAKAAAILKEEVPHLPMMQPPTIYGVNAKLRWTPRQDGFIDLRGAYFED